MQHIFSKCPIGHVQGLFHFVYSTVWPSVKLHLKLSPRSCPKFYNLPKLNAFLYNCGTHWIFKIYSLEGLFYHNIFLSWHLASTTIKYIYNCKQALYQMLYLYYLIYPIQPYNPTRQWLLLFIVYSYFIFTDEEIGVQFPKYTVFQLERKTIPYVSI